MDKSLINLLKALKQVKRLPNESDSFYYSCFGTYREADDHCNKACMEDKACHVCRRMGTLPSVDWIDCTINDLNDNHPHVEARLKEYDCNLCSSTNCVMCKEGKWSCISCGKRYKESELYKRKNNKKKNGVKKERNDE